MKHLIFGSGLIGTYMAGCFINQGLDISLHGRPSSRQALANGLIVSDLEGHRVELAAPTFAEAGQTFDVIWLTVKATSVEGCLEEVKAYTQANTLIVCCQNGFGSDAAVREVFAEHTVINAIMGNNVAVIDGNEFKRSTDGVMVVESDERILDEMIKAHSDLLNVRVATDMQAERWAKLQLNLANAVNAVADVPAKQMSEDSNYRKVISGLMRELIVLSRAMKMDLPTLSALPAHWLPRVMGLPNWIYLPMAQKTLAIDPTARSSMWWDLSQNKPSEIAYLNQALVEKGKELGISCPMNERLVAIVQQVERGERQIGIGSKQLRRELMGKS